MSLESVISKKWFIQFRWYLGALAIGSYFAARSLAILDQSFVILVLTLIILCSNLLIKRFTKDSISELTLFGLILLDIAFITVGLFYTGGASNPFSILYLVYVVFSAILLSQLKTIIVACTSVCTYGLLLLAPEAHNHHSHMYGAHLTGMWFAYSIVAVVCCFTISQLSALLKDTLKERESILHRETRLRSLTTLAAGAAHELRTPLSTVLLYIDDVKESLKTNFDEQDLINSVNEIERQISRCVKIIGDLNANSGQLEAEKRTATTPDAIVTQVLDEIGKSNSSRISIVHKYPHDVISVPLFTLSRSITNLIKNALESKTDAQIKLETTLDSENVHFTVKDDGRGITKEILDRVGEPFVTDKPLGSGMGLGLFVAKLVANTYGGDLFINQSNPAGTTITLTIKK